MAPRSKQLEQAGRKPRTTVKPPPIEVRSILEPRDKRPLSGYDVEDWRGRATPGGLSKKDAAHALGLRNTHHYDQVAFTRHALDFETELLLRIYMEFPGERSWRPYTKIELFEELYGQALKPFAKRDDLVYARVDLRSRFTALFGRSGSRQYQWLEAHPSGTRVRTDRSSERVEAILSKLRNVPNGPQVLERTALLVHKLRGNDLDLMWPVPTVKRPPIRQKTGRRPKPKDDSVVEAMEESQPKKTAAKAPSKAAAGKKVAAKPRARKQLA